MTCGSSCPPAGTRIRRSTTSRSAVRTSAAGRSDTATSSSSSILVPATDATRRTSWPASETAATRASTTSRSRAGTASLAGLARRGDHLLGVERIPVGPLEGPVDQPRVRGVPELIRKQPSQLVTIEPGKVDAIDALVALELGQERQEGAARIDLVGPDRGDEQHTLVSKVAHQERQEVARRLVGPLEVLDHEKHGAESGDPFEDPEDELEQADLGEPLVRWRAIAIERIRRRPSGSCRSGRPRTSGISRASSPRLGPRSAGSAPGSTSRKSARNASTNGPYGSPPVPSGRHPPTRTRAPDPPT